MRMFVKSVNTTLAHYVYGIFYTQPLHLILLYEIRYDSNTKKGFL